MANIYKHMANLYNHMAMWSCVSLFTYVNEPCVYLFTYVNELSLQSYSKGTTPLSA